MTRHPRTGKPLRPEQRLASKDVLMTCQVDLKFSAQDTIHALVRSPLTGITTEVVVNDLPDALRVRIQKEAPGPMRLTAREVTALFKARAKSAE